MAEEPRVAPAAGARRSGLVGDRTARRGGRGRRRALVGPGRGAGNGPRRSALRSTPGPARLAHRNDDRSGPAARRHVGRRSSAHAALAGNGHARQRRQHVGVCLRCGAGLPVRRRAGWVGAGRGATRPVVVPPLLAGREHGPLAGAGFELPAVVGLQAVAVGAEPVEVHQLGDLDLGPVDAVVDLEVRRGRATPSGAPDVEQVEHHLLAGGGPPAEVGDVEDVDPVGDDQVDGGLRQTSRPRDGPRPATSQTRPGPHPPMSPRNRTPAPPAPPGPGARPGSSWWPRPGPGAPPRWPGGPAGSAPPRGASARPRAPASKA